jgi:hypothetical protein
VSDPTTPGPGGAPRGPGDDETRRVDPPPPPDAETRRVDPPPPDAETRRIDPGGGTPELGVPLDATQQLDATEARPAWEAEVPVPPGASPGDAHPATDWDDGGLPPEDEVVEEEPTSSRGKSALLVLLGAVLGFALAFLVVALATGGDDTDADLVATQEQVDALEAELEARDATIADLEAQLAEAEAAAGERDEDIEAQRQALDDRSQSLDDREAALDARQDALDEREAAIVEREEQAGAQPPPDTGDTGDTGETGDTGDGGEGGDTGDGGGLPDIDTDEIAEEVENVVERILDWLRGLFE